MVPLLPLWVMFDVFCNAPPPNLREVEEGKRERKRMTGRGRQRGKEGGRKVGGERGRGFETKSVWWILECFLFLILLHTLLCF